MIRKHAIGYAMIATGCLIIVGLLVAVGGFWVALLVLGGTAVLSALFVGGIVLTTK